MPLRSCFRPVRIATVSNVHRFVVLALRVGKGKDLVMAAIVPAAVKRPASVTFAVVLVWIFTIFTIGAGASPNTIVDLVDRPNGGILQW